MAPTPTVRPVFRAIHKPLRWFHIDWRVCFAAEIAAVAGFSVSWMLMVLCGGGIFLFGKWLASHDDPQFLTLLLIPRRATRYDPFKSSAVEVRLR